MNITIQWHNIEQTVLLVKMHPDWHWGDMYQAISEIEALLDTLDNPVCTLFDFTDANKILPDALTHLRNMNRRAHFNQDMVAVVGLNLFGESMINIFIKVYGKLAKGADVKLMATVEQAYEFFDIKIQTVHES